MILKPLATLTESTSLPGLMLARAEITEKIIYTKVTSETLGAFSHLPTINDTKMMAITKNMDPSISSIKDILLMVPIPFMIALLS